MFFNAEECDLSAVSSAVSSIGGRLNTFAIQLGLFPDTVEVVEKECAAVSERLQKILSEWLRRNYDTKLHGLPSWRLLCTAVASEAGGRDMRLASEIADQHLCITKVHPKSTGTIQCHVNPACKQALGRRGRGSSRD